MKIRQKKKIRQIGEIPYKEKIHETDEAVSLASVNGNEQSHTAATHEIEGNHASSRRTQQEASIKKNKPSDKNHAGKHEDKKKCPNEDKTSATEEAAEPERRNKGVGTCGWATMCWRNRTETQHRSCVQGNQCESQYESQREHQCESQREHQPDPATQQPQRRMLFDGIAVEHR